MFLVLIVAQPSGHTVLCVCAVAVKAPLVQAALPPATEGLAGMLAEHIAVDSSSSDEDAMDLTPAPPRRRSHILAQLTGTYL